MLLLKGSHDETVKFEDFEIFGHSHPKSKRPIPSTADLMNMKFLQPEFIVSGASGKIIFMNIDDKKRYWKWKMNAERGIEENTMTTRDVPFSPKEFKRITGSLEGYSQFLETEDGRDMFFRKTGVKIYQVKTPIKVEMVDLVNRDKYAQHVSKQTLEKWDDLRKQRDVKEAQDNHLNRKRKKHEKQFFDGNLNAREYRNLSEGQKEYYEKRKINLENHKEKRGK